MKIIYGEADRVEDGGDQAEAVLEGNGRARL